MPVLYHLQRDAVADPERRRAHLRRQGFVLLRGFVSFLEFFGCFCELVFQLYVFLIGPERIGIIFFIFIFDVLALDMLWITRLIGLSRNLIFFCSLSSSFPFMPSTSSALLVLFLSYPHTLTSFIASGRHLETFCRACGAYAKWSTGTMRAPAMAIYAPTRTSPAAPFSGGSSSATPAPFAILLSRC